MRVAWFVIVFATALLPVNAPAAPAAVVEVSVTAVELDDAARPFIAEVEVMLVNRSEQALVACEIELQFLDAAGRSLMSRKHAIDSLDLKPGAETLASFQDTDPPKGWARIVTATAKCR